MVINYDAKLFIFYFFYNIVSSTKNIEIYICIFSTIIIILIFFNTVMTDFIMTAPPWLFVFLISGWILIQC